jgi:hypothetical protein
MAAAIGTCPHVRREPARWEVQEVITLSTLQVVLGFASPGFLRNRDPLYINIQRAAATSSASTTHHIASRGKKVSTDLRHFEFAA